MAIHLQDAARKRKKRKGNKGKRKPVTAGELRRNRVSHIESKSKCKMQNANHYFGCSSCCTRTCLLRWLRVCPGPPLSRSLSLSLCLCCLPTSHCGTFRLSIALGQLIDAHKSVKRVHSESQFKSQTNFG